MNEYNRNNISYLRHCATLNSANNIITGQQNISIIDKEKLMLNSNTQINNETIILASTMYRCKDTVEKFIDFYNLKFKVIYTDFLIERNMGIFENMNREDAILNYGDFFLNKKYRYELTPPNGEKFDDLRIRVEKVIKLYCGNENIIICSHNHIMKLLFTILNKKDIEYIWYKFNFETGKLYSNSEIEDILKK